MCVLVGIIPLSSIAEDLLLSWGSRAFPLDIQVNHERSTGRGMLFSGRWLGPSRGRTSRQLGISPSVTLSVSRSPSWWRTVTDALAPGIFDASASATALAS